MMDVNFGPDTTFREQIQELRTTARAEIFSILKLAGPAFLANLCNFGSSVSNAAFLGHISEDHIAAGALANTWMWATAFIAIGLTFGMDTLVSQAYGSGNYRLVGILLQNALVVVGAAAVPVAALWLLAEPVLLMLGQVPELAAMSAGYLRLMLPGLPFLLFYRLFLRFLNNQRIVTPSMVSGAVGLAVNVILNYIFIIVLDLKLTGAALSNMIVLVAQPIVLFSYVYYKKLLHKTWHGFSREGFNPKRLITYVRFAVPSGLMVALEVWGFEVSTVLAGHFGALALASHSVTFSVLLTVFVAPLGMSVGTSIRVGNLLGEGRPYVARAVAQLGFLLVLCTGTVNGILISSTRTVLGRLFSNDEAVLAVVRLLFFYCALMQFFDGIQTLCGGVLRGAGLPTRGTIMNFIGYYLVGVPLGAGLGFGVGWGLYGLWAGIAAGLAVVSIGDIIFLLRVDWPEQSRLALIRSEKRAEDVEQLRDGDITPSDLPEDEEGLLMHTFAPSEDRQADKADATIEQGSLLVRPISPADSVS